MTALKSSIASLRSCILLLSRAFIDNLWAWNGTLRFFKSWKFDTFDYRLQQQTKNHNAFVQSASKMTNSLFCLLQSYHNLTFFMSASSLETFFSDFLFILYPVFFSSRKDNLRCSLSLLSTISWLSSLFLFSISTSISVWIPANLAMECEYEGVENFIVSDVGAGL